MGTQLEVLSESSLGATLSARELQTLLGTAGEVPVRSGHNLFDINATADSLYVIVRGNFDVMVEAGSPPVAKLGPGQVAGELEVVSQTPRVAALTASEDSVVLQIDASRLHADLQAGELYAIGVWKAMATTLARRLMAVNQKLVTRKPGSSSAPAPKVDLPEDEAFDVLDKLWS